MGRYLASVEDHLVLPAVVRLPVGEEHFRAQQGRHVATPVPVRLLIDTGSKRTTLIPGIVRHLDPPAGIDAQVVTPLAMGPTTLYWVRLEFPEAGLLPLGPIQVARLPMPAALSRFHGLLGRDLLDEWEAFLYEGRRRCYMLRDAPGLFGWLWHHLRHWL
ncbi:MAG: hypothetical protein HYS12_29040 [Planctomycetes bacterium]|nr:hypothetical protein [Planctomycetota bacterium]